MESNKLTTALIAASIGGALTYLYSSKKTDESLHDLLSLQPKKVQKFEQKILQSDFISLLEPFFGERQRVLILGVSQFLPTLVDWNQDVTVFLPPAVYSEEKIINLPHYSQLTIETSDTLTTWTSKFDIIIDIGFRDNGHVTCGEARQEFYVGLHHVLKPGGLWLSASKKGKIKSMELNGFHLEKMHPISKTFHGHLCMMYLHIMKSGLLPSLRKYKSDFRQCSQRLGVKRDLSGLIEITDGQAFEYKFSYLTEDTILRENSMVRLSGKSKVTFEQVSTDKRMPMHYVKGTLLAKRKYYARRYLEVELPSGKNIPCLIMPENMDGEDGRHFWRMHTLISAFEKDGVMMLGYPCLYRKAIVLCVDELYLLPVEADS